MIGLMVSAQVTTRLLSERDLDAPIDDRWFADYVVGSSHEYGWLSLSPEEIVEFATRYDPQRIHTDPEWAATGPLRRPDRERLADGRADDAALLRPLHLGGREPRLARGRRAALARPAAARGSRCGCG